LELPPPDFSTTPVRLVTPTVLSLCKSGRIPSSNDFQKISHIGNDNDEHIIMYKNPPGRPPGHTDLLPRNLVSPDSS